MEKHVTMGAGRLSLFGERVKERVGAEHGGQEVGRHSVTQCYTIDLTSEEHAVFGLSVGR